MNGRKIPEYLENPIDNLLIKYGVNNIKHFFFKLGFTANDITTLSLIFGLISVYLFKQNFYISSSIIMFIAYFFDVMDGNFARTYNMQSNFGDMYDHVKDTIIIILISFLILTNKKTNFNFKLISVIIGFLLLIPSLIHLGCIEKYVEEFTTDIIVQKSQFLKPLQKYCKDKTFMKRMRFFGTGTANLWLSLVIFSHHLY